MVFDVDGQRVDEWEVDGTDSTGEWWTHRDLPRRPCVRPNGCGSDFVGVKMSLAAFAQRHFSTSHHFSGKNGRHEATQGRPDGLNGV